MDFENFYNKIMNIDKSVQYSVILSKNGEKMFGGYRKEMEPTLTYNQTKLALFQKIRDHHGRL